MSNSLNIAASHEGKLFIVKQSVEANPNAVNTVDEVYFLSWAMLIQTQHLRIRLV
jgi:hypothetical protein